MIEIVIWISPTDLNAVAMLDANSDTVDAILDAALPTNVVAESVILYT
jgi:hypothetical protein